MSLAEERERRRIAAELHDGAVQDLGLTRIKLGSGRESRPMAGPRGSSMLFPGGAAFQGAARNSFFHTTSPNWSRPV